MNELVEVNKCRVCYSEDLIPVLSLGEQYVVGFMSSPTSETYKAPLELIFCDNCKLLGLKHTMDHDILYREYWYKSGISFTMTKALEEIVRKTESWVKITDILDLI